MTTIQIRKPQIRTPKLHCSVNRNRLVQHKIEAIILCKCNHDIRIRNFVILDIYCVEINYDEYFVRDVYSVQTGPKQVEFGHVFEDPDKWEQRYEKKDHENKRFQGKV